MDTAFVRERFTRERRILARLEHPGIARLIDGGATEDGLPYFVMERVEGRPTGEYCDAKLIDPDISDDPARTITELRMMTPDYASPEQARGLATTTASDIYSLGAVLYELLTGQRPHRFKSYSMSEIERVVCIAEPEKPSAAAARETAAPAKFRKQLAGDLDNIILMAMRKEPERRYQSVEQFSEDIRRHLEGLPVIARNGAFTYRAGKFARRRKLALAAVALVILSLAGGVIATTRESRIARAERAKADIQRERAERRFLQVRKLANTFLFDFYDKIQNLPGSTEARETLVKTAFEYFDSLAQEADGDPSLQKELATAYLRVGDVQGYPGRANLGQKAAALESYRRSAEIAEEPRYCGTVVSRRR